MTKSEYVMEKLAINSSPTMRLAVRLQSMYGNKTSTAIRQAKGITEALTAKGVDRVLSLGPENRVDILQRELETAKPMAARTPGRYSPWKT
jgi:hypothetical protein